METASKKRALAFADGVGTHDLAIVLISIGKRHEMIIRAVAAVFDSDDHSPDAFCWA